LAEVSSKQDSDTSKWGLIVKEIPQGAIQSLHGIAMNHGSFIPDDDASLLQEPLMIRVFLQVAG